MSASRTCHDTRFDFLLEKLVQFFCNHFGAESHGPNTTTPLASAKTTEPSNLEHSRMISATGSVNSAPILSRFNPQLLRRMS